MKKRSKAFLAATFTLVGTVVGAGILGLPYVFAQSGFGVGLFWLFFLGLILLYVNLCFGELTLRTRKFHQMPGYAEEYLGKKGKIFIIFAFGFSVYSALLAYLIGEGQSLSYLFTGGFEYAVYFTLGFWLLMTLLLHEGLKGLKKVETLGVITVIILVFGIFIYFFPQISVNNFDLSEKGNFFLPIGVVLFALLGYTAIPEMRILLKKDGDLFRSSIFLGKIIPLTLYVLFVVTCIGVFGKDIPEVSTLALGKIATVLGVFTMMTCYFAFSFALKDMFRYDLGLGKTTLSGFFVSIVPLLAFLLINFFGFASFVLVLSVGGAVAGGLKGIAILVMNKKAKEKGNRNPEYSVPINWFIIFVLGLIFISGIVFELWSLFS